MPYTERELALIGAALWNQYEGEAAIERAIEKTGSMLSIDVAQNESYIDTVGRVCRERTGIEPGSVLSADDGSLPPDRPI